MNDYKYKQYKISKRDSSIISYATEKLETLGEYKNAFIKEWNLMHDRTFKDSRTKKGTNADENIFAHVKFPHEFSVFKRKMADFVRNPPSANFSTRDVANIWRLESFKKVWENKTMEANLNTQLSYAFSDVFIGGFGFIETGYLEKYRDINEIIYKKDEKRGEVYSLTEILKTKKKRILEYDGLYVARKDPNDVWVDENAVDLHGNVQSAKIAIIKDTYDIVEFRSEFEGFLNYEAVIPVGVNDATLGAEDEADVTEKDEEITETGTYVHVYRIYLPPSDECYYIANGVVIYDGPIPFGHKQIPLIMVKSFPYSGNLFCPSDISMIQHIAEVKNTLINLGLDNKRMILQRPIVYVGNDIDPEDIVWGPNQALQLPAGSNVRESVQFMDIPDISGTIGDMIGLMEEYQMMTTGVDTRSLTPDPNEKATQTAIKREISNIMMDLTIKYNEMNGLKTLFEQLAKNLMEFYPREKVRDYLNPQGLVEEKLGYPEISIEDYKVSIENDDESGDVSNIIFEESPEDISLFEVKGPFIRQQLVVEVQEGSMTGILEELDLQKWNERTQIYGSIPEASAQIDWKKWMQNDIKKNKENPDDFLKKEIVDEMTASITEPVREIRSLVFGQAYIAPEKIDHKAHADSLRKFIASDYYKKGSKDLKGHFIKLSAIVKQNIQKAFIEHLQKSLLGEQPKPPQPEMGPAGVPPQGGEATPQGGGLEGGFPKMNVPKQKPKSVQTKVRSDAGKLAKSITKK